MKRELSSSRPTRVDQYFTAYRSDVELKRQAVRGGAITMAAQAAKFVLQMGSTMTLARLLTPADFGLVAMVTAVTGFVALFKDAGLSMATIQREEITHEQVSTLFWINVGMSAVLMLLAAALAPAIAFLYSEPRLVWVTVVIAGTFLLSGLTIQHQALLRRRMEFKALGVIDVIALTVGIAAAIVLAAATRSYWALVAMPACFALSNAVAVWIACPWRPGRPGPLRDVWGMLGFGGHVTGFRIANYFARRADNILIGWAWGAGALGLYSKAYALLLLPITQINGPLSAVAFPAMSRLQNDPQEIRRAFSRGLALMCGFTLPLLGFIVIAAEDVALFLLGPQWIECGLFFRLLAVAAAAGAITNPVGWLLPPMGRTKAYLRIGLVCCPLIVLSFIAGLPWGPAGVSAAYSGVMLILIVPTYWYVSRHTPVTVADVARAVSKPLAATLVAAVITGWWNYALPMEQVGIRLLSGLCIFAVSYLLILMVAMGELERYRSLVRTLISRNVSGPATGGDGLIVAAEKQ